jgi:hypothetical protein
LEIVDLKLQAFGRFWPWVSDRAPSYALLTVAVFQYALKNSDEACHPPDVREEGGSLLPEVAPPEMALTILPVCYGMRERGLRWDNKKGSI